jgi:hypothetical protein
MNTSGSDYVFLLCSSNYNVIYNAGEALLQIVYSKEGEENGLRLL